MIPDKLISTFFLVSIKASLLKIMPALADGDILIVAKIEIVLDDIVPYFFQYFLILAF
jgi:hypothetical protein